MNSANMHFNPGFTPGDIFSNGLHLAKSLGPFILLFLAFTIGAALISVVADAINPKQKRGRKSKKRALSSGGKSKPRRLTVAQKEAVKIQYETRKRDFVKGLQNERIAYGSRQHGERVYSFEVSQKRAGLQAWRTDNEYAAALTRAQARK